MASQFFFPVLPLDFGGRKNHESDQHETTTRWAQKTVIDWIRTSFIGLFFPPVTSFYKVNYFRAFMTPIV